MLIAQLTISYDRGLAHNDERDLSADTTLGANIAGRGFKTADGKIIRGLGTHFKSESDRDLVKAKDQEAARIRTEFRKRFIAMPIDGCFIVPRAGIAKGFISDLGHRDDIKVYVTEYNVECPAGIDDSRLAMWSERIKNQLSSVSLGRSKEADEEGLRALETLAECPVIKPSTCNRIKELVAMVRDSKIERVELKRSLETLDVEIAGEALSPRRMPALVPETAL